MIKYSQQHPKCFTVDVHREYCVFRIESVDVCTDTIIKPETDVCVRFYLILFPEHKDFLFFGIFDYNYKIDNIQA